MLPIGPNPNHYENQINPCPDLSILGRSNNTDPPPGMDCHVPPDNQNNIGEQGAADWLNDNLVQNLGNGAANNCDPMQAGKIVNDPATTDASEKFSGDLEALEFFKFFMYV